MNKYDEAKAAQIHRLRSQGTKWRTIAERMKMPVPTCFQWRTRLLSERQKELAKVKVDEVKTLRDEVATLMSKLNDIEGICEGSVFGLVRASAINKVMYR